MMNGNGSITSGIELGTLVRRTIAFVRDQLPEWRDDPTREPGDSEEHLNTQLSQFLNVSAQRKDFSMVHFHHEKRQTGRHRVDLAASPTKTIWIGSRHHSVYEPFLVMEGKRLPAPSNDREREYVTGNEKRKRSKRSGGIQRFKLGLHGASLDVAAMIGYVQAGNPSEWHETINDWISELAGHDDAGGCSWDEGDRLRNLTRDRKTLVSECESTHQRFDAITDQIRLHHLWIEMKKNG